MASRATGHGVLDRLSIDLLLLIFDNLDLPTLLTANNVCSGWRALLKGHWRRRYLALEDVDTARKWRLRALDGEKLEKVEAGEVDGGDNIEDEGEDRQMPEGDGRGVSGPPVDSITFAKLALQSGWQDEFQAGVIDALGPDSTIRQSLDRSDSDAEIGLPSALDLVYQYGTRLDKPDWHQLCLSYAVMKRNWKTGNVVQSIIAPLYIPDDWQYCILSDDDPGDDAILFTAYRRKADAAYEFILITVERSTGEMRHVTTLPMEDHGDPLELPNQTVAAFQHVGMALSYVDEEDQWQTYVSGRALNHLCPDLAARGARNRHIRSVGSFPVSFNNLVLSHAQKEDALTVVQYNHNSLEWERLRSETVDDEERDWDHSTRIDDSWNIQGVQETDSYILLGTGLRQVNVYLKSTMELVASLPAGVTDEESRNNQDAQVALLAFRVPMSEKKRRKTDMGDVVVRPLQIEGHVAREDEYWLAVQGNVWGNGPVTFEHFAPTGQHMFIKIENGGFLLIPYFEDVVAQSTALPFDKRARFVAQRTILIDPGKDKFVPYATNEDQFVLDFVNEGRSATFVLDLASLPPLSPDLDTSPPVTLKGHVILRRQDPSVELLDVHVLGGHIYEHIRWFSQRGNRAVPGKTALRITSYEPDVPNRK